MDGNGWKICDRVPYVIFFVDDLSRSLAFYRDLLELQERDHPVASRMGGRALAIQGTTLILLDKSTAGRHLPAGVGEDAPSPGHCYPSFATGDLKEFHTKVTTNGVSCAQPPRTDDFGEFAVYRDPDGLLFSVVQAKKTAQKHAVVLSGGGALGAFELGVLSRLADDTSQPDPEIFTGTSVGGYNAAVLTCRYPRNKRFRHAVDDLIDIWRNRVAGDLNGNGVFRLRGDVFRWMDRASPQSLGELASDAAFLSLDFSRRLANLATSTDPLSRRLLEMVDISALLSTQPLQQLVEETVSFAEIRDSPRVLKLAATDWSTGKLRLFTHYPDSQSPPLLGRDETPIGEDNARLAILASAAIPGVFPPIHIPPPRGTPFVDGGIVMNTPLNPAIDAGADVIHLICLNPDVDALPLNPISNTVDVLQRLLVAAVAGHVSADLSRARLVNSVAGVARRTKTGDLFRPVTIHRYHPPPDHLGGVVGMLDFSLAHIEALMEDGVRSAKHHDCKVSGCILPAGHEEHRAAG